MGGGSSKAKAQSYEPVKSAAEVVKSAGDETSRAQQLRRGISSTFSRNSMGGSVSSATSGSATKLGA